MKLGTRQSALDCHTERTPIEDPLADIIGDQLESANEPEQFHSPAWGTLIDRREWRKNLATRRVFGLSSQTAAPFGGLRSSFSHVVLVPAQ